MASEKIFNPARIYRRMNTHTLIELSNGPPHGQITLRGARGCRHSRIRVSHRRTDVDTCSTSDYPAMTLTVFHSLSISTRLNLHLAKSSSRRAVPDFGSSIHREQNCFPAMRDSSWRHLKLN